MELFVIDICRGGNPEVLLEEPRKIGAREAEVPADLPHRQWGIQMRANVQEDLIEGLRQRQVLAIMLTDAAEQDEDALKFGIEEQTRRVCDIARVVDATADA